MSQTSAVEFPTQTRVHFSLNVRDLASSIAFYRALFGQPPTKTRADYAKFEVLEPALNLALTHTAQARAHGVSQVSHFGIQVKSTEEVASMAARLQRDGLEIVSEQQEVTCCYAVQTKIWVQDPDGNAWEVFVVLDANAETFGEHTLGGRTPETVDAPCCPATADAACCAEAVRS